MATLFNADEVFQIAIHMEERAALFYRAAARRAANAEACGMFEELAQWEDTHLELFNKLRRGLSPNAAAHPIRDENGELAEYLRMIATRAVYRDDAGLTSLLDNCREPQDVLRCALRFEEEAVKFYETMQRLVPEHFGAARIVELIDEERKHAQMLRGKLQGLS